MVKQTKNVRRVEQTTNKFDLVGLYRAPHLIHENILSF